MLKPAIAIITPNTLAGIGLSDIIHRMMPGADTVLFSRYADLNMYSGANAFFHYFVSADEVLSGAAYFLARQHKTIVLTHGADTGHLPQGFHSLDVCLPEAELVRNILLLAQRSHGAHGAEPHAVKQARLGEELVESVAPKLTPRECDVLRGVVKGLINKEIAACMGVSLATVITHRKNLTEKIGTRSVSALTIYAVAHGLVRSEDI